MVIMSTRNTTSAKEDKSKYFWDRKAKKYPLPFAEKCLEETERMLRIVKQQGVVFAGKEVLDIGCGTGIYTLPIAREAASVTGLDFSETMLDRLNGEIKQHHIKNVKTLHANWRTFDISSNGFEKVFDIVWTAMSMGVTNKGDVKKMEQCSKTWCVYVGWGNKRKNTLMEEVFKEYGMVLRPPPGANAIFEMLIKMKRHPSLDLVETSWDWEGTVDEALEDLAGHIEMERPERVPNLNIIRDIIAQYAENNIVRHTTYVEEGIIVWRVT
jgi:SAM-dependent methyltransferase